MIDPQNIEGGDYGRVIRQGSTPTMIGHGENEGYTAITDSRSVTVPWGDTVQVSTTTERPGDDSKNPTLLHIDTAKSLARNDQFEPVE